MRRPSPRSPTSTARSSAAPPCRHQASSPSPGSRPPRVAQQRSDRGMFTFVVIIHVIVSLIIIGLVLLQAGKGADIGSAFGGSGSQAVFGSMGTPTVLGKITSAVAIVFLVTSFSLAVLSHHRSTTIMPASAPSETSTPATPSTPAAPAPAQEKPAPAQEKK